VPDESLNADRFAELLRGAYEAGNDRLLREYQRSLPFQDTMFDRWERARHLRFGEGSNIYNSAFVYGDVRVGRQDCIGPNTLLDGSGHGGLEIGDFSTVAVGVHIYTHDTVLLVLSGRQLPRREAAVRIGACVYIGPQSIISAGVTIGDRCVIAANSFVNTDVPDGTVVGGSPARRLGSVIGEGTAVRIVFDRAQTA
jgi:acetyltransferase-like isoleucine patch superfamily enzyme